MEYQVRKAGSEDFSQILKLYENARAFMASRGNPHQWGKTEPRAGQLQDYLRDGDLYVLETETGIHGSFFFRMGPDPTYALIRQGSWMWDAPYGVIHCVAGDGSGGTLQAVVSFAEKQAEYLRIDTHRQNFPMQKALKRAGFLYQGIIFTARGEERLAYARRKAIDNP